MVTATRKQREGSKELLKEYHASAANSLVKEGRLKELLMQQEVARYAAAGTKVEIAAARNGHEAFQVFIAAPAQDLNDVTVEITPFVNEQTGRKIDPEHINLFVVESVRTCGRKPDKYWPDILNPYKRFDVPKGGLQPVWVSIHIPKGTGGGEYRGQIEVRPTNATSRTVQVHLKVWDFDLPEKTDLTIALGFTTLDYMSRFYDFYPGSTRKQSAMVRKYLRFLNEHRINTLMYGYTCRDPHTLSVKQDSSGRMSYDFTKMDSYLRLLVEMGMRFNIFSPPFWHQADLIFRLNPLLKRFEHLGNKLFDSPEFDRAVGQLLSSYVRHLRRKGWLKNAFCYVWDEPPANRYGHMRRMCELVKKVAPEVKRLTTANHPPMELEGHSDIWCPNVGGNDPSGLGRYEQYRDFYTRRQREGDEVWWYIACAPHPFPCWFLDYPLVDCRIPFWLTWRYGMEGIAYWNTNAWHYGNSSTSSTHGENFQSKVADRWPNRPWDPSLKCSAANCTVAPCQGNGQLVYPGPDGPIGSMRLEAIRDGIEDYEYLRLLERQSAILATKRSTPARQKLLRTSQRILSAARRAANSTIDWEQDGQRLLALRVKIGWQIEAVSQTLRE